MTVIESNDYMNIKTDKHLSFLNILQPTNKHSERENVFISHIHTLHNWPSSNQQQQQHEEQEFF